MTEEQEMRKGLLGTLMYVEGERYTHISKCKECLERLIWIYDHVDEERRRRMMKK